MPANSVAVVLMRGGTSKGVFVRDDDLPTPGPRRDSVILALMGSPDPMQIDGLGGTHSSTSKLVTVSPSAHHDCDVDYEVVQVGIDSPLLDTSGNCGNLTAAVALYAVEQGLLRPTRPTAAEPTAAEPTAAEPAAAEPMTVVRMFNRNTGTRINGRIPAAGSSPWRDTDLTLAGMPATGTALATEYLEPAGAVTGALLPTGRPTDLVRPRVGEPVEVSIVDVSAPVAFVRASDLGLAADVSPSDVNARPEVLARLESVRAACAVLLGFASDELDALTASAALPRVALVSPPADHVLAAGRRLGAADHDLLVRATSMQRAHHACPLTTAMCTAAASAVPGTIPYQAVGSRHSSVRIAHPKGVIAVDVRLGGGAAHPTATPVTVSSVSVLRTARRLLAGTASVLGPVPSEALSRHV